MPLDNCTFLYCFPLVFIWFCCVLQCRLDYKQCHMAHRQNPSQHSLTEYIDAHNAYVQQLHATNGMLEAYHGDTLPQLMQELEEIHNDLCNIVSDSLLQGADVIASKVSRIISIYGYVQQFVATAVLIAMAMVVCSRWLLQKPHTFSMTGI